MRDWTAYVRRARLRLTHLSAARESRIVRELAAQLEDFYRAGREAGAPTNGPTPTRAPRSRTGTITPFDPLSYAGTAAVLLVVALACDAAARRAMTVDPLITIRQP